MTQAKRMNISPFFVDLRSAYQSEMDDLRFDSEGRDVLRQRLTEKRKEIDFLLQMMALSPEMVAVIFHQAFAFRLPAVLDNLLSHEADELPEWSRVAEGLTLAPWAQELAQVVLEAPGGEWFLTVAAALEYMHGRPDTAAAAQNDDEFDDDEDDDMDDGSDDQLEMTSSDEDGDQNSNDKARREAGADWLAGQGFDRKD